MAEIVGEAPPTANAPQVPKKGKGKGPAKGPPPAKGAGKAKEASSLPSWQKPDISSEWQPERMVNWQPIRQTSRIQGSVWQQVHDSLEGGAAQLPEDLLGRFMRKASEAVPKKTSEPKKSATKRLLPSKQGLVADIHHALLTRKGIRSVHDLKWIIGPSDHEADKQDEATDALSEELLEALLGLLGAAVGEERSLTAAGQALKDGVQSEIFLRQILQNVPLQELQSRVQLSLDMARFPLKAADLESGLDLALTAAWSIIDSRAVPILLEGILLLGNSVNASSKNLGGAVGVTLDSLTKLAHTRCLPAKQAGNKGKKTSSRVESALEVLAWHLDEANEGFIKNLASDLDACHAAKDFDRTLMDGLVQELAAQTTQVKKHLHAGPEEATATSPARLSSFLEAADPQVVHLRDLLEEVDEATESLRQWFAEPPTSSLHDMLTALAALREMLPTGKPADMASRPRAYRQSETRKRRLEEKAQKAAKKESAVSLHVPETGADSAPAEMAADETASNATVSERGESDAPKEEQAQDQEAGQSRPVLPDSTRPLAAVWEIAPSAVLAQILSFRQGTVWMNWVFDWEPCNLSAEGNMKGFEILQFNACEGFVAAALKPEQALQRWRCQGLRHKFDVPLGCHYTFAVRAVLLPSQNEHMADAAVLWASAISSAVTVDLRYYSNCLPARVAVTTLPENGASAPAPGPRTNTDEKSPSSPSPRRGRVASSMGDFLQSLQASGGGSPPRRPSFRTDVSPKPMLPGGPSSSSTQTTPVANVVVQEPALPTPMPLPGEESPATTSCQEPKDEAPRHGLEHAGVLDEGDVPSPQSLPSRSGESWASEASLSEFDDASLARLAQALRFLEGGAQPKSGTASQICVPRANSNSGQVEGVEETLNNVYTESFDHAPKPEAPGDLKTSSAFKVPRAVSIFDNDETLESIAQVLGGKTGAEVSAPASQSQSIAQVLGGHTGPEEASAPPSRPALPRAASIFDDQDTLDSMAEVLSNVQNVDRTSCEQVNGGLQPSLTGDLLDGNEVLAAAERAFKKLQEKPCSACGGTGYVGLFGAAGFGFFQSQCTSCQTPKSGP